MSTNAQRLGRYVLARRLELDLNQLDVHAAGGPSNSTLTEIENGRLDALTRATARKLDKGLRWEAGSARAVWDGGEPVAVGTHGYKPKQLQQLRDLIGAADVDAALRNRLLEVIDDGEVRGA